MDKSAPPRLDLWARIGRWWKNFFWLKDIFALEFGTSDVQSNYSRVYGMDGEPAWPHDAGYCGGSFVHLDRRDQPIGNPEIRRHDRRGGCRRPHLSVGRDLCAQQSVTWSDLWRRAWPALAAFLLWRAWTGRCHTDPTQTRLSPYTRIPKWLSVACHAVLALALIGVVIYALSSAPGGAAAKPWAKLMGTIIATLVIAAGVIVLCKDAQVLFLSLFGLLIVFVLGSEVARGISPIAGLRWEVVIIGALMFGVAIATYALRYTGPDYGYLRESGANWWREIAGGVFHGRVSCHLHVSISTRDGGTR